MVSSLCVATSANAGRPYLDCPYQLALNILDGCDPTQLLKVRKIADRSGVAQETARQVLLALKVVCLLLLAQLGASSQSQQNHL